MKFDKILLIEQLTELLESNLQVLIQASNTAKEDATNEESKAENKYDTRGLEASYLAGAQSKRVKVLQESIYHIHKLQIKTYNEDSPISSSAIVGLQHKDSVKYYFLLPIAGGLSLKYKDLEIQSLSINAPLGESVIGKYLGDEIEMEIKGSKEFFEIVYLQ